MNSRVNRLAMAVGVVVAVMAGHAAAQAPAPSENATINLIRLLVSSGVLQQDQAQTLIQQAETEALQARQAASSAPAAHPAEPGDVRVPYIPAVVRNQIRDEVKQEVMAQAKEENWAQPNTFPDWASRISFEGDMRLRNESRLYSNTNSNEFFDFAQLNEDGPYDVNQFTNSTWPPILNSREDRENMLRLRARFGLNAQLSDTWKAGIRIGTGSDSSPVSTTQTLGAGFGKKDIWLDRGYITWTPSDRLSITGGRIANPFMSTDLLYSNDLNFDGMAAIFNHPFSNDLSLFGTLGAFPVEYTSDASTPSFDKQDSENKWLYGLQVGADWRINNSNRLKGALAYYQFDDIEGQRSSPCEPWSGDAECDSDGSRASFMQKGNTLFLLRDITLNPSVPSTDTPNPQYVGLASEFNLLDLNLTWETDLFNNMKLGTHLNYVHNLGYDESEMRKRSAGFFANNLDENGEIESGANAWMLSAALGNSMDMLKQGDWNVFAGYKYIQPDALPDGFNDSTFHLGGTNAKGYFVGGHYGLADRVYGSARWLSSEEVYGAPFEIDVLQLELNTRF
ncbi:putative porin [Pseudomonas aestusnigri]|uniref:putative porin n=1 Tax=Halopseudomonas aestusnigri TaxID=857252 RepID=UPI001D195FE1|nr:putative porin [Halopseudomonas aestusnigri]MCC4262714.1 putative porin [Halopseudomonas aestusnigri]